MIEIFPVPSSIRRSLFLLVSCAILPALFIILYFGLSQREQSIRQSQSQLHNLAVSIASLQKEKAEQARLFLLTLSSLPEVKERNFEKCNTLFGQILRNTPDLANIVFVDTDGVVRASGLPFQGKVDLSDRRGIQEALRHKNFSAGEYLVSRIVNIPVFNFYQPVFNANGQIAGVLFVTYDLSSYNRFLGSIQLRQGSRAILIDRNGLRLFSFSHESKPPPLGVQIRRDNWEIMSSSEQDEGFYVGLRSDNVECLFSFIKIRLASGEDPYMYVQTNVPRDVILDSADSILRNSLLLLGLAALLALVIARVLGKLAVVQEFNLMASSNAYNRSLIEASLDPLVTIAPDGKISDERREDWIKRRIRGCTYWPWRSCWGRWGT